MTDAARWKRADAVHHDREADRYDDLIGREFAPYQDTHTAGPWARQLASAGARVTLDIGGGTGRTALALAEAGLSVVVLDMSRGMLDRARHKAARSGLRGLSWIVADAESIPLADGSIDGVVCQGVLHHLPDVETALSEADRVLVAGGRLCLAEPDVTGSVLSRLVHVTARVARPAIRAMTARRSPAAQHERPLRTAAVLEPLHRRGYAATLRYIVHPPYLYRFLPAWTARVLAGALNPAGRRRVGGDMVVIEARKPAAPRSGRPTGGMR